MTHISLPSFHRSFKGLFLHRKSCIVFPQPNQVLHGKSVNDANQAGDPPEVSKKELIVPGKRWEAIREGVEDYAYLHLLTQAIRDASPETAAKAKTLLASWIEEVLKEDDNPLLADKVKKQIMEK